MAQSERPLSPHLQIYRWHLPMATSILHRVTGVALAVGTLLLVYWVWAAGTGPEAYAGAQRCIGSWLGKLALFGWSAALFYHLCNGIRHLGWDAGWGFELKTAYATGYAVIAGTIGLTVLAWILGFSMMGRS
jgi:succinate dehydrogenase / fumarate reductase cytochrome b subunit